MIHKKERIYVPANLTISWENIEPLFNELVARSIGSVEELEQWLRDRSELEAVLEEDFAWRYIRMTCNTADQKLLEDFQYFATEIETLVAPLNNDLNKKFIDSPFLDELNKEKYEILIRGTRNALELFREQNVPLLTEIQVKQQKYQAITGAMTVSIDGKEYTMEQAGVLLKSPDRALRKKAWETISKRRLQDREELDFLFNELLALRHQVAQNAGFENFRDYMFRALGRFDYTPKDCYKFHEAIEKVIVPILQDQADSRTETLGLDTLKPWDLDVDPAGRPALQPFGDGNDLIEKSIACFKALDPFLGTCLSAMKENDLFDVESRKGKAPGGYNYPLAETGAPFIFMNSAGSFRDLTTMVHEGGHAVHTFLSAGLELNDFKHCPSEVAELASMSMELISMDQWSVYFGDNDADLRRAIHEQLKDVLKTLPWVAVVDQFQHWIYTNPHHTSEQRREAWVQIFGRFGANFADWQDYELALENLWQKQLHIFEVPFYYIEYAIAQLGAIAVWKNYKENPQLGLKKYKEALSLGYTKNIRSIYEAAGIKFDFSSEYVQELADFVEEYRKKI